MRRTKPEAARKLRSRAYPAINLSEAVEVLRKLRTEIGLGPRDREAIARALGYAGGNSGIAARKTAALAHYGIMDLRQGMYTPTAVAEDLLRDKDDERFLVALRKAFLSPSLFQEITRRYEPVGRVPRQLPLTLSLDHGIQDQAVEDVARIFMESATYALILESDGTFRSDYFEKMGRPLPLSGLSSATSSVPLRTQEEPAEPEAAGASSVLRFPVTDHKQVEIRLPARLNEQDILLLRAQIDFLELQVKLNRPDQPVRLDVYRDRKRQ
ncbi:MAG TPA: hypothetical protein VF789_08795 [Thermoanaerobaculia bacterium]